MTILGRMAIGLVLIFSALMGMTALVAPLRIGEILGLAPVSAVGVATLRGDFGAIFLTSAMMCAAALFFDRIKLLLVSIALLGITCFGRVIELAVSGSGEGMLQPIIIEAVLTGLLLFGFRTLNGSKS